MKSAVLTSVALAACTASAIDLDTSSPESIRAAARTIAGGMIANYTGNQPGEVPGLLPDAYFWWQAGSMFTSLINYWALTGDSQYNDLTTQGLVHQLGDDGDYMPTNQSRSLGNDDQSYWAMAALTAAERGFPAPQGISWDGIARTVFETQTYRWDNETCGGGLRWQVYSFNQGYDYKNSISTGNFMTLAARLARYTGNQTYASWAETAWDWSTQAGLVSDDGSVYDGASTEEDCGSVNQIEWTANSGVYMLGAAYMFNMTSSDTWRQRLSSIIDRQDIFFPDGIMVEKACEEVETCSTDQFAFKAQLARYIGTTIQLAPFTRDALFPRLDSSARAAASACNVGDNSQCGFIWTGDNQDVAAFLGNGEQQNALEVVQQLLATAPGTAAQPSSRNSGNPNAAGSPTVNGTESGTPSSAGSPPVNTGAGSQLSVESATIIALATFGGLFSLL